MFDFGTYKVASEPIKQSSHHKVNITSRGTRNSRVIYPNDWMDFRRYDTEILFFYEHRRRDDLFTTKMLKDSERSEFIRFYDALTLWERYVPKEEAIYSAEFYWLNSIQRGDEFADWLKDQFAYSYRESFACNYVQPSPDAFPLKGYNDLFPYQGLLKFKPVVDDYLYSLVPAGPPEADDLNELIGVMEGMFREVGTLELVHEFEILSEVSTSSAYNAKTGKTEPHCLINDDRFSSRMEGKRCVVHVFPGGSRDTVILTKASSNTTRLLERQMRHILEKIPESAVTLHASTYQSRMTSIQRYRMPCVHYLRDIKKCGLTFPLSNLVDGFCEAAERVFPSPFWRKFQVFKDRRVIGLPEEPGWVVPARGYFLGMANHLATFLLIALNRLAINRFYDEYPDAPVKFRSIIGNDDSDIVIIPDTDETWQDSHYTLEWAEKFAKTHNETMFGFGVWINHKKSFLSHHSLFYEEYTAPGFEMKQSRYAMIIANCLTLPSIRMAKHMLKSFLSSVETLDLETLSPMICYATDILGFEFDEDEGSRDYYLGGWIQKKSHFLSNVLFDVENRDRDPRYLHRIFDYVIETERLDSPIISNVKHYSDNAVPFAKAMQLSGKPSASLRSLVVTKADRDKYYRRLIDFQRKPLGYNTLVNNLWIKSSKKVYNTTHLELCSHIVSKVDCNLPPSLVKEYTTCTQEIDIVNSSWIGYNELDMANRTLKSICADVSAGRLKCDFSLPMRDSWAYASYEYKAGLPDYISDFPFVLIAKGDVRNISSDGFATLGNHVVDYGLIPKSVLFDLPERDIPSWRSYEKFLLKGVFPIEELENEFGMEDINLQVLGVVILTPVEKKAEPPPEPEPEKVVPETGEIFIVEELQESPIWSLIPGRQIKKKEFSRDHWQILANDPQKVDQYLDEPCKYHEGRVKCSVDVWDRSQECLGCRILSEDPTSLDLGGIEEREEALTYMPRDKLLRCLGFQTPEPSDDEDGDDAFDMFA